MEYNNFQNLNIFEKRKTFYSKTAAPARIFMQRSRSYSSLAKSNIVTNEITNNKSK